MDDRFWIQGWSVGFRCQKYDQNRDRSPFLDFWIFGFLDFRISGFLDFWIFGFPDFRISGFLDFWISGF